MFGVSSAGVVGHRSRCWTSEVRSEYDVHTCKSGFEGSERVSSDGWA